jgi:hypothetical protein
VGDKIKVTCGKMLTIGLKVTETRQGLFASRNIAVFAKMLSYRIAVFAKMLSYRIAVFAKMLSYREKYCGICKDAKLPGEILRYLQRC